MRLYSDKCAISSPAACPKSDSILLVESGTRGLLEGLIAGLRQAWGDQIPIDLVTCYATPAQGLRAAQYARLPRRRLPRARRARTPVSRTRRQPLRAGGDHLLRRNCHGQVEMGAGAAHSGQAFYHQRERRLLLVRPPHLGTIRQFVLFRSGLAGSGAVRTLVRLISFPFTLLYLLLYASSAHARRAMRKS